MLSAEPTAWTVSALLTPPASLFFHRPARSTNDTAQRKGPLGGGLAGSAAAWTDDCTATGCAQTERLGAAVVGAAVLGAAVVGAAPHQVVGAGGRGGADEKMPLPWPMVAAVGSHAGLGVAAARGGADAERAVVGTWLAVRVEVRAEVRPRLGLRLRLEELL